MFTNTISTIWKLKAARADREIKLLVSRCDICNNRITEASDDLESQIDMLNEIDDSYESEYDKHVRTKVDAM